jgi:ABC-type amino acid transport substrate-binding protein
MSPGAMRSIIGRRRGLAWVPAIFAGALLCVLAAALPTLAETAIPPSQFNNSRPLRGDRIRFCVDDFTIGARFDRAVAKAIADSLLLEADFVPAPSGFPLDGGGYLDELELVMSNECEVLVGISIAPGMATSAFPDWATVTRPYAQVPFVLVARDPAYSSLADIPQGKALGGMMGSLGLSSIVTYNQQRPAEQRVRYLPYGDADLMLTRLLDGSLAAMIIWQPQLARITKGDPAALGLRQISVAPMKQVATGVGNLVSSRDSYLRASIDGAIGQLVADGTIARLMKEHGYEGTPGP